MLMHSIKQRLHTNSIFFRFRAVVIVDRKPLSIWQAITFQMNIKYLHVFMLVAHPIYLALSQNGFRFKCHFMCVHTFVGNILDFAERKKIKSWFRWSFAGNPFRPSASDVVWTWLTGYRWVPVLISFSRNIVRNSETTSRRKSDSTDKQQIN